MFRLGNMNLSGDMWRRPQTRGFLWGAGVALAAYFVWPAVKEAIRPATKGVVRGAMVAGERLRYAMAGAKEGLEDLVAEAQYERTQNPAGSRIEQAAEGVTEGLVEGAVSAVIPGAFKGEH